MTCSLNLVKCKSCSIFVIHEKDRGPANVDLMELHDVKFINNTCRALETTNGARKIVCVFEVKDFMALN